MQWLVEAETKGRFGGDFNFFTASKNLRATPGRSTRDGANGSTLAAASNGAEERT